MKRHISLFLALAALLVLTACSPAGDSTSGAAAPVQINIFVLTGPTGIGAVNLWDEAEQNDGPESYRFTAVAAPDEIVAKISSGEADIAAVSTNLASALYHKTDGGVVILAVNTLGVLSVLDNTGAAIHSMADLRGRHIVTTGQGANPEYIIKYLLNKNGVDPEADVDIEFKADGSELTTVWALDPEAAIIAPQPVATAIKAKYEGSTLALSLTDEWKKASPDSELMMGCLVVRRAFLEAHPEAVGDFLKNYAASVDAANADPASTGELCERYGIVAQAKIAQAAIPYCGLCCITGEALRDGLTGYLQVLLDADASSVGGALPGDDFWYAP